jgi:putative restriction endonuclease
VNYSSKCAISAIDIPELLVASHIVPWSVNENERLNPENGICLSPIYDKAFDKGFIGINTNFEILYSEKLLKKKGTEFYDRFFLPFHKQKIAEPTKYFAKKEFLDYHLDTIFLG